MAKKTTEAKKAAPNKIIELKPETEEAKKPAVICQQIHYYREKMGLEQKQLSQMLGLSFNAANHWEKGRSRPDVELLPRICEILNITLYELFALPTTIKPLGEQEKQLLEGYKTLSEPHQQVVLTMISSLREAEHARPFVNLTQCLSFKKSLAAGIGDPTEFEEECEKMYLHSTVINDRADYVFTVNGDSMEPEYHNGDRVLVRKVDSQNDMAFGDIGAFMIGNELYIKQYEKHGLHSLNSAYPLMSFDEYESVYLIGKVIGILDEEDVATDDEIRVYEEAQAEIEA